MPEITAFARANVRWIVAGLLALVLAVRLFACGDDGSAGAPAAGATHLVPADALVYVHLSTDTGRSGTKHALDMARGFPGYDTLRKALVSRLVAPACGVEESALKGKEVSLALLQGGSSTSTAGSLVLLDTGKDQDGTGRQRACGGVQVQRIGRFLAVGQSASLRTAADLSAGRGKSLAADPRYARATASLPEDRVADGWASQDGVRRLLAPQGGLLGAAGVLLDQPGLVGAAIGVTAEGKRAKVTVRSEIDSRSRRAAGSAPFRPFKPSLQDSAPAGALAYLGVSNIASAATRVLAAAGSSGSGITSLIAALGKRLGPAAQGRLDRDLLSLFRGETAIILTPSVPAPTLTVVARTKDEAGTRDALQALQAPLERALTIRGAPAPQFRKRGSAFQLRLAKGLEFDYAVFDGKLVVSTQLSGIAAVRSKDNRLPGSDPWKDVMGGEIENPVTSLVFLDFSQLLRLGEQTGLNDSRAYLAVKDDLQKVRAIGARSQSGKDQSTAEITLSIP